MVGNTVRDYRIERLLGQGGMGAVFLATHTRLDRKVAVKVLPDELAKDETFIQRFEREARAVAQLHHPAIVQVHDMFEEEGNYYLILEYLGGGSIRDLLEEEGPLPEWAAACLIRFAALGLHAAAEAGFVHRDIKPDNLLLTENGEVKIADFGLVHMEAAGTTLTEIGTTVGTPAYMAPEQWEDIRTCDHRTDLYSLGCTLYELLVGEPPFLGPSVTNFMTHHLTKSVPPLRSKRPDVSQGLEQVVLKLLSKKQGDRFTTGAELAEALDPFCETPHGVDSRVTIQEQNENIAAAATMPLGPPTPHVVNNPQIPVDLSANPLLARALQNRSDAGQQQTRAEQTVSPQVQQQITQQQAAQPALVNQNPVPTAVPKSTKRTIGIGAIFIFLFFVALLPFAKLPKSRPKTPPKNYLEEATKLAKGGKWADCAWLLTGVGNTKEEQGRKARDELRDIVDKSDEYPAAEAAQVLRAAIEFARHGETLSKVKEKLFKKGYSIVEKSQTKNPAGAALVLDALRELAPKTLDVDNIIETFCQRELQEGENNQTALAQLAKIYLRKGRLGSVISLLEPHINEIRDSEAAGLLGQAYSLQGMYAKALPLLQSCGEKPMKDLLESWKEFKDATTYLFDDLLNKLKSRTLGSFDYSRFSRLDEHGQRAMVYDRLALEIFSDMRASVLFFKTRRLTQNLSLLNSFIKTRLLVAPGLPLLERKKEAKVIESQIKELRSLLGQDRFFLYHGMACHLLGRRNMTRARFDRLLLRNEEVTVPTREIINAMQAVGAKKLCKSLLEEAFSKTEDSKLRTLYATELAEMCSSLKDKIQWLKRCEIKGKVKMHLELLYAQEYLLDGEWQEGRDRYRRLYRLAADFEDKREQKLVVFLAATGIYELTGQEADLDLALAACEACFGEELPPFEYGAKVFRLYLCKALSELTAGKFQSGLVMEPLFLHQLKYVYPSEKSLKNSVKSLKENKWFKHAMIIVKQSSVARAIYAELLILTEDYAGLSELQKQHSKAFDGQCDYYLPHLTLERANDIRLSIDMKKHPSEFAYATSRYVELVLAADDKSQVALAASAFSCNNAGASTVAVEALIASSLVQVQKEHTNLKSFIHECRRLMPLRYASALAAACNSEIARAIYGRKNTKKALGIWKRYTKFYPSEGSAFEWALCKDQDPEKAAEIKRVLLNERSELRWQVIRKLNATNVTFAVESYLRALMAGNPLAGEKILAEYRARGLPIPKMSL